MNFLFDISHPAHIHLFKNFIIYLKSKNHKVIITSRDKDITNNLLDHYKLNYISISKAKTGLLPMFLEMLIRDIKIFKLHFKHRFDYAFGTSVSIGHLSFLTKVKSYNFCEDDDELIPIQAYCAYPTSTKIIIPEVTKYKKWKKKRVKHNSYHELAYLHPNNFAPDKNILKKYNLKEKKYALIRLSALTANHDNNIKGIDEAILEKIKKSLNNYEIIYSIEGKKNIQINPLDMHHLLAFSKIIITDSQTMAMEAAILGIPNIRCNSFVGKISVLKELDKKYGLTYGIKPENSEKLLPKIEEIINNKNIHKEFKAKKDKMLSEKVDFNKWLIDFYKSELEK